MKLVIYTITWRFPEMEVPQYHPNLDHFSNLKQMMTWGSPILRDLYIWEKHQVFGRLGFALIIVSPMISTFLLSPPYVCWLQRQLLSAPQAFFNTTGLLRTSNHGWSGDEFATTANLLEGKPGASSDARSSLPVFLSEWINDEDVGQIWNFTKLYLWNKLVISWGHDVRSWLFFTHS